MFKILQLANRLHTQESVASVLPGMFTNVTKCYKASDMILRILSTTNPYIVCNRKQLWCSNPAKCIRAVDVINYSKKVNFSSAPCGSMTDLCSFLTL